MPRTLNEEPRLDCSKMLAAADETYRRNLYGDTSALFGVSKDKL